MRIFYAVLGVTVLIVGVLFAVKNSSSVVFNYYLGQKELPLAILLVGFFAVGTLLGFIISLMHVMRLRFENHRHKKKIIQLQDEISDLRLKSIQGND